MKKKYYKVLTIAGSDSSGGAGIQADLKTFSALGCYGMSVITALTAQNTGSVDAIHAVPVAFVIKQLDAVLSDINVDAVKIGMLYSAELIESVVLRLKRYKPENIVLDPVMTAQSGEGLMQDTTTLDVMIERLLPIVSLFTPNLPEASIILNHQISGPDEMKQAVREIASFGSTSVLLKGGHGDDKDCSDLLFLSMEDRSVMLKGKRIQTRNDHGTGCTLSSAIACFLAKGFSIEEAALHAKDYITGAIMAGRNYAFGNGRGPLHHYYKFW